MIRQVPSKRHEPTTTRIDPQGSLIHPVLSRHQSPTPSLQPGSARIRQVPSKRHETTNARILPTTARPPPAPIQILTPLPPQALGLSVFGYLESHRTGKKMTCSVPFKLSTQTSGIRNRNYRSILRAVVPRRRPYLSWIPPNISKVSARMSPPINTSPRLARLRRSYPSTAISMT
jgi:hypothetical protein